MSGHDNDLMSELPQDYLCNDSADAVEPRLTEQSMPDSHPHTVTVLKRSVFEPRGVLRITFSSREEASC